MMKTLLTTLTSRSFVLAYVALAITCVQLLAVSAACATSRGDQHDRAEDARCAGLAPR